MSDGEPTLESSIEGLVELEDELSGDAGAVTGTYSKGTLSGAEKIPARDVPDDYPVSIPTSTALRLVVEADDGTAIETFLAWPEQGSDVGHVERLLEALGRTPDEFADLYGDEVALTTESGWHVLDLRRTAAVHGAAAARSDETLQRSEQYVTGAVGFGILAMMVWAADLVPWLGTLVMSVTWLVLPIAVYTDMKKVKEKIPWDTDEGPWVLGCLVPLFNVPVGTAYLIDRHVRVSGVTPGETADLWLWAIFGSMAALFFSLPAAVVSPLLFGVLVVYGVTLLPLAVYFDAEYVEDATDWDPDEEAWAMATAGGTLLGLNWVVAGAYLVKRYSATSGSSDSGSDSGSGPSRSSSSSSGRSSRSMADRDWDLLDDDDDWDGDDDDDSWGDAEGWGDDGGDDGGFGGDDGGFGDAGGFGGDGGGGDGGGE